MWFILAGTAAVLVNYLVFEYRYTWYLGPADADFIRSCFFIEILFVVGLWILFPSRLIVATVGVLALVFPPLYNSNVFPGISWQFVGWILFSVGLLVVATELRRRSRLIVR